MVADGIHLSDEAIARLVEQHVGVVPSKIRPFNESSGAFHHIYYISFNEEEENKNTQRPLVLRVSRPWIGGDKTRNEVAFMKWAADNLTKCPVPKVVCWSDNAETSIIGCDFTLLSFEKGTELAEVWQDVDMNSIVKQTAKIYLEMARFSDESVFSKMGGLVYDEGTGTYMAGPWIEETTYTLEEYAQNVQGSGCKLEFSALQVGGPFDEFSEYVVARLRRDQVIWENHAQCTKLAASHGPFVQQMSHVLQLCETNTRVRSLLNSERFCIHHNDFHLHNILVDPATSQITAVLDWELATVGPIDLWIRRNTFYGNTVDGTQSIEWQEQLREQVTQMDPKVKTKPNEFKDKILSFISLSFWIVKCTVTATQEKDVINWIERLGSIYDEVVKLASTPGET